MTVEKLEALIDERANKRIEEAKASIKAEMPVGSVADEKALASAIEKEVSKIMKEKEAEFASNKNLLKAFEKANEENAIKGLQEETTVSIVNKMIGANLFAMQKFDKTNVKQVTKDELLASAKELFPMAKALHAVIENKDLNTSVPSAGGFTVPVAFSADYIEALYANTILDKLGVTKIPMPNGNLSIPKMTASASASWIGESKKINKSEPTFGGVNLKAKKLCALCPVSNDLLKYSGVGIEAWVMNDLREKVMIALDDALLNGSGSAYQPLGILNQTGIESKSGALAVDTPFDFEEALESANIPMTNVKWLASPRMKSWLRGKAFASGPFAWANELASSKTLDGYGLITSSTVANADSAHGTLILGDWSQLLWGVGSDITFEMSRDASYDDGSGTMISAFQNDQTLIKVVTSHDFGVKNAKAFCKGSFTKA
ncbi:MAG: phage major capsid protein [Treponema sp.]|nr:phage major capsid protein [Treponema sp.]